MARLTYRGITFLPCSPLGRAYMAEDLAECDRLVRQVHITMVSNQYRWNPALCLRVLADHAFREGRLWL